MKQTSTDAAGHTSAALSTGFAPVIDDNARLLILGSLPSQMSLDKQQYYANPRNSFWQIMHEIAGTGSNDSYESRCKQLIKNGIALWDVLASSKRPGSLDSAIDLSSATGNDFSSLFDRYQGIALIAFNGRKARNLFDRLLLRTTRLPEGCKLVDLPSSSPAHAAMTVDEKIERWSVIDQYLD